MSIRWGIIGCGDVARRRVAAAIQADPGSELRAVCRRNQKALDDFCTDFNVPIGTTDANQLINSSDLDALYIATPVYLHCQQTIESAVAGKHVLVEKPMAMSVEECEAMIQACRKKGVKLGVAYYRRFYPVVQRMIGLIAEGAIGTVLSVSAVTCNSFQMDESDDGYWRVVPEEGGGGALMDIGSHRIDLLQHIAGAVADVHGFCDRRAVEYNADNCSTVSMRFESGVHGLVQCFFSAEVDPDRFSIIGTAGQLVAQPLNSGQLEIMTVEGSSSESHPPHDNFNVPLIADFVAAIRTDRPPLISGELGMVTNQVMARAYGH